MPLMSPGVEVNEIDLSIVVPVLGNATAAFAGEFTKGPSEKYLLITNGEELIENYGYPTNANYNDWFQAYNFLQYANKLLVSRAVDANGTFTDSMSTVNVINETGKVEVANHNMSIVKGSFIMIKTGAAEYEYQVQDVEAPVTATSQISTVSVDGFTNGTYDFTVTVNGTPTTVTHTATGEASADSLASALQAAASIVGVTASVSTNIITLTSTLGTSFTVTIDTGAMSYDAGTAAIEAEGYELVLDTTETAEELNILLTNGDLIYIKDTAINAIVDAPAEGETLRTADDLKIDSLYVPNDEAYEIMEMSLEVNPTTKLKFMAKSTGSAMNGIEIAIAREADFTTGKSLAFSGVSLNEFFETKPSETDKEVAVLVRKDGMVTGAYVVSTKPDSKDYRNKSNYIEDIINKYDAYLYVKDNTTVPTLPEARLFSSVRPAALSTDPDITDTTKAPIITSNGTDGEIDAGDIADAYGSVSDNTIFGNKEEIDIDIIIGNEKSRVQACTLAVERADCIAFVGSKFGDVVGLKSAKIVENLIADVNDSGDDKLGAVNNSFSAYFGNYKYQYDKFNDKFRWVSVAGDVAGLRGATNTSLNTWWASAGLDRGQIKNAEKIAFNPNLGQRDLLYKNKVNPIVSFPGQGNAIVWGQKTLQSKPSAFDRVNVRGLFNTLERAISRMAKHYLFEFNDIYTRNRFTATIKPFLEGVKAGRGVYDFHVRCDENNNTAQVIDNNQFIADIAIKPTRVAEFITLNFVAVGTGVDFNEIFV